MAQGCNLVLDSKDFHDIKSNLVKTTLSSQERATNRLNARKTLAQNLKKPKDLRNILLNKEHTDHAKLDTLLKVAMVGERTPRSELYKLSPALGQILKHHHNLPGMFQKVPSYRSKTAASMNHHYEVTATAKLTQMGEAGLKLKTLSGVNLAIGKTDQISFGYKQTSEPLVNGQRKGTYEPDLLIDKSHVGRAPIGIDMKFTKNANYNIPSKPLSEKLEQISTGILTGKLESFNFVTNAKFGNKTRSTINKANAKLVESYLDDEFNNDFKENYNKICSENNVDPKEIELSNNIEVLDQIVRSKDGEGFFGIAENVVFEG